MRLTPADDVNSYVDSARMLELMALDLAQRDVGQKTATQALIEAAAGDVRIMRRAHRHCEFAVADQWPVGRTLLRAFDYLCAGRRELETKNVGDLPGSPSPDHIQLESRAVMIATCYDAIDEASMDSFPASDAPSFWASDPHRVE